MSAATQNSSPVTTEHNTSDAAKLRQRALARWDSEGGAGPDGPQKQQLHGDLTDDPPIPTVADVQQLHARIIALENLVIVLLAGTSDAQRDFAREMAGCISPRSGSARHPLTINAAHRMLGMIERAEHLRDALRT